MSFTQEKRIKVRKCQGCEKRCELGYTELRGRKILPKIGDCTIDTYIDENNQVIDKRTLICFDPIVAMKTAREIAKLCDHYQYQH